MASSSTNVGRDELAAMLGASRASDLLATAAASTTIASGSAPPLAAGLGGRSRGPQQRRGVITTAKEDIINDVSRMDRAQAAALVARQFNNASSSSSRTAGAGIMRRHRAGVGGNDGGGSMNNKRKRNYQLLVEENLMDSSSTSQVIEKGEGARRDNDDSTTAAHREVGGGVENYLHKNDGDDRSNDNDTEEEEVVGGQSFNNARTTIRKKVEARVIVKNTAIIGDGNDQRRRNNRSSSSESDSSNGSSSSSSSSSKSYGKRRRRRRRGTNRRSDDDSSSSSEEDEADIRRRRVRERAARENEQSEVMGVDRSSNVEKSVLKENEDTLSVDSINIDREKRRKESIDVEMRRDDMVEAPKHVRRDSTSSTSDDSTSLSSDDYSSSSSSDESDHIIDNKLTSIARPVFVPKSQRGTVTDIDIQQKKLDEIEERKRTEAQKRTIKSRALVAEMTSEAAKKSENDYNNDGGDEFDTGETGGVFEIVPDDTDPTDENGNNLEAIVAERDAWEVRELLRILRDIDHVAEQEKERKELERRRALTDDERLAEDRLSGRYRTPGETRRSNNNKEDGKNSYLQRFHHRGAFYMDEDTLNNAGKDDVRHKAAEYARAATGEDKIDKSALPKVMQTKYFGLSGHSTKYQGLAKEDTTDKKMDFLPIRSGRR